MGVVAERPTVRMVNIPLTTIAKDLLQFLESQLGKDSVFAIEIFSERKNWKPRGYGRVQFSSLEFKHKAQSLSLQDKLVFKSQSLKISETYDDIIQRPIKAQNRVEGGNLYVGFMREEKCLCVLESWNNVRGWMMPERSRVEFWVTLDEECYKIEVRFEDILEATGCCLELGNVNAVLLKLKYGPRIYRKISGPDIASKFCTDRYHICKEDFDFLWVRTTDFSAITAIGQSTSFCWEIKEGLEVSDIFRNFPFYKEHVDDIVLDPVHNVGEFYSASELVPLVECGPDSNLAFEVLFQLNSLVHTHKISPAAVDSELVNFLSCLSIDTAVTILQKLQKSQETCYDLKSFVERSLKESLPSPRRSSINIMSCQRALITPSKIYCLGPELETSNYVVNNFAAYTSDFMRVTFVEEDWSKLPANALSTSIKQGIFARPFRTTIYDRILSILQNGFVIGAKRFEFLAFSASQLRSNSVWMFASNDELDAEEIRKWMGSFEKIRSASKRAARMGQLFSSSKPTCIVPMQDVEIIPDVEVTTDDGITYCFSDGIGKISLSFAKQVATKCGLSHIPSAFQIRYGGYKGVVAVDRNSFRKLSLRKSMLKFESENGMLNIAKCSDSMPCYLNREIVILLSTLGVRDEMFQALQQQQLHLLGKMLSDREAALDVLENLSWADSKNILVKMLVHGYKPNMEPYLAMMLQSYHENLLTELRGRCRVFVPKGRVLIGCLDETGILEYGQVYVRLTLTKAELQSGEQSFFQKVDEKTSIIVGKVVVTKNPCLHPGDVRVLDAVYEVQLQEKGLVDCVVFPQRGQRDHPSECSGGDLDGDQYFICWDEDLIPCETDTPMDCIERRTRIMDRYCDPLEEIQKFFVDYMVNDSLGAISTAHLVHADREPEKARSKKCLQLAALHSMAVDFAKTGAPAEMPKLLKPREFPDFMERTDRPMYISNGVLGKLYRDTLDATVQGRSSLILSKTNAEATYDHDLEVDGFQEFVQIALTQKEMYMEKIAALMNYYGARYEDEILTGNLRAREAYLQRDNRRYGDTKDRIVVAVKALSSDAKGWFESRCEAKDREALASAWYHVTYHPTYCEDSVNCLSFPWIVGDILLGVKSRNSRNVEN